MPLEKASELARGKKDWVTEGIQEGENPGETENRVSGHDVWGQGRLARRLLLSTLTGREP